MPEARPALAVGPAADTIFRRPPAPALPQPTASEAAPPRFAVPRYAGEDAAAEADMAELFARVLRREARRQGIVDEGGAA